MSWGRYDFAPYVPVAQKLGKAVKLAAQVAKKQKREPAPVKLKLDQVFVHLDQRDRRRIALAERRAVAFEPVAVLRMVHRASRIQLEVDAFL